jgi:hypothetical protein
MDCFDIFFTAVESVALGISLGVVIIVIGVFIINVFKVILNY